MNHSQVGSETKFEINKQQFKEKEEVEHSSGWNYWRASRKWYKVLCGKKVVQVTLNKDLDEKRKKEREAEWLLRSTDM